ncbi:hypothetical protein [Tritonibacter horizontis]|uniref:Uncharacterized protein n=1 Tax=Tritonibacter horizontis TaxID=1768241 RepID=A0A132BXE3_9RHOB|nr:hypothetical protein [Tritonibacter horizontis]KUP93038.1 hypothetical protein TRIHO_20760 [Tritonibacter horizontis]
MNSFNMIDLLFFAGHRPEIWRDFAPRRTGARRHNRPPTLPAPLPVRKTAVPE